MYRENIVVASGARTSNGDTGILSVRYNDFENLRCQLDVTAASGTTPTLDVVIEDTIDGSNWNTIGTFAQKTTTGREVINITIPFAGRVRVRWTIGGATPSFTFSTIIVARNPKFQSIVQ